VFAPEWVDLAEVLGVRPRACRPYRAKTKAKVERVIGELKQDFLAWATGQPMPPSPMLADYDRLAATWCIQVVAAHRHRTSGRVVAEACHRNASCSARSPIGCSPTAAAGPSRPRPG
jgi:transposase